MPQGTKTTSLEKLTAALTEHGWRFESVEKPVLVPDQERAVYYGSSSRASRVPRKQVPGVEVTATNGVFSSADGGREFTAQFTADGRYLGTSGNYPFNYASGSTLTKVLHEVENRSPGAIAKREQKRAEQRAEEVAEFDAKVATAYSEAQGEQTKARHALRNHLYRNLHLTGDQANAVIEMLTEGKGSLVADYLNAATQVERTGKGWLPGENYTPATYVDGKRVDGGV